MVPVHPRLAGKVTPDFQRRETEAAEGTATCSWGSSYGQPGCQSPVFPCFSAVAVGWWVLQGDPWEPGSFPGTSHTWQGEVQRSVQIILSSS